jgi:glycosyltransferase involved in cell wall biosynthesis
MRIGIDATALPSQPVGAGNYIIQLIRSLVNLESGDKFVIFAQESGHSLINISDSENVDWVIFADRKPGSRLLWEQIIFPKHIQESGIELLHSLHYTQPLRLPCSSVVTLHDMTFFLYPRLHTLARRWFFPLMIRTSAKRADALIAISESTRQDAIQILGIPPKKITTTQLGVDSSFQPIKDNESRRNVAEKYDLPEKFILYVGLVEPRKNLPLLINAYQRLAARGTDYQLVIVGRFGWMYEDVTRQIKQLNLGDKVHLTGYVPQEDLPLVYNLASLFVYPTRYEGFGLPALEAMACGTPVITTNVSSLPEIVAEAGLLIPPDDVQALYEAMESVLDDRKLGHDLSRKGTVRSAKFTWQRTAQQTLQIYRQVLHVN